MVRAMFFVDAKDGYLLTYYAENPRFDHVSGELLLRLPAQLLGTLVYYGLYKFVPRLGTDKVLAALEYRRWMKVGSDKKASNDGFVRYFVTRGEGLCHEEK